jgi:hypothetical protein
VGLSGRVCALVATDADGARAQRAAQKGGFLLDLDIGPVEQIPHDGAAFNLIVVDNQEGLLSAMTPESRVAFFKEAHRTLQARGRIVIIERGARGGLGALFKPSTPVAVDPRYQESGGAVAALEAEGFRAVRLLAERDGLSFFEGVR